MPAFLGSWQENIFAFTSMLLLPAASHTSVVYQQCERGARHSRRRPRNASTILSVFAYRAYQAYAAYVKK